MTQATPSSHSRFCLWPSPWSRLQHPDSLDIVCDQVSGPSHIILTLGLVCNQVHGPHHIILTLKILSATKSMIQATSSWQSGSCLWPSPWPRPHHSDCLDRVCDKGQVQGHISFTIEVSSVAKAKDRSYLWLRSWPCPHHPHTRGFVQVTSSWQSRSCLWPSPWPRLHHPDSLYLVCDSVHGQGHIITTP